jgi:hypothetical protein
MAETGPVYNVPLIDALPIGGMFQQMPSRDDLMECSKRHMRVAAAYEVLLNHYRKVVFDAERYRKLRANHWSEIEQDELVVTCLGNVAIGSDCPSSDRLDQIVDLMGVEP